jgi:hypothetical protein
MEGQWGAFSAGIPPLPASQAISGVVDAHLQTGSWPQRVMRIAAGCQQYPKSDF